MKPKKKLHLTEADFMLARSLSSDSVTVNYPVSTTSSDIVESPNILYV